MAARDMDSSKVPKFQGSKGLNVHGPRVELARPWKLGTLERFQDIGGRMFERYTERARRVLFFARYEASQLGSISIETEHLLLGLIREGKGLTSRIFARSHLSLENIRKEIEGRTVFREKVSTSVEIPFSAETKRVLAVCG